jgi:hypothetical protein
MNEYFDKVLIGIFVSVIFIMSVGFLYLNWETKEARKVINLMFNDLEERKHLHFYRNYLTEKFKKNNSIDNFEKSLTQAQLFDLKYKNLLWSSAYVVFKNKQKIITLRSNYVLNTKKYTIVIRLIKENENVLIDLIRVSGYFKKLMNHQESVGSIGLKYLDKEIDVDSLESNFYLIDSD